MRADTSELRFGGVQKLILELETLPRTEHFNHTSVKSWIHLWGILNQPLLIFVTASEFFRYSIWNFDFFAKRGIPRPKPVPLFGTAFGFMKKV